MLKASHLAVAFFGWDWDRKFQVSTHSCVKKSYRVVCIKSVYTKYECHGLILIVSYDVLCRTTKIHDPTLFFILSRTLKSLQKFFEDPANFESFTRKLEKSPAPSIASAAGSQVATNSESFFSNRDLKHKYI
jgi:hypothetical protein